MTYRDPAVKVLNFGDDFSTLQVSYTPKNDVKNLKDPALNTGKSVTLEIRYRDTTMVNPLNEEVYLQSTVTMGWNLWKFPVTLIKNGEKYTNVSVACGFFNN